MSEREPKPPVPADPWAELRHDLRTGVNQMLGYAELLEEEAGDLGWDAGISTLRRIQTAARTQLALVDHVRAGAPPVASAAPPQPTPRVEEPPVVEGPEAGEGAGTILVVDDDAMNRDMLSRRLRKRGFQVDCAEGGRQALACVEARPFDLVLLDVNMPEFSGLEVLTVLRQSRSSSDLPVIMATARDTSEDVVEALRLGANDYVTKPLDFPVVLARVQSQLTMKRQADRIRKLLAELDLRNRFIRQTFGRFLSDEVVAGLLESPQGLRLGGESRRVTILMSDLRGFTALSEHLGPEQVVRMLNGYLEAMADVILAHRGTIDEFIGDAILAIFGAPVARPDDAERAVACAVTMQLAMEEVNRRHEALGLPALEMGIAVHTGDVVVGNIGSERRSKYGVVGPPVNLAGRIESCTVGGQVLVSQATVAECGDVAKLGAAIAVRAKGAKESLLAYDLLGVGGAYQLMLPDRSMTLARLAAPLPVSVVVIAGKQVGAKTVPGRLTALALSGAELYVDLPLEPLDNLRLTVGGARTTLLEGDLYAKVVELNPNGSLLLRFTSVPRALAQQLGTIVEAGRAEACA